MKVVFRFLIVILGCVFFINFILRNEIQPTISHRMPLEVSWVSALASTLRHDLVSGRDYYYTYGVLSQVVAYLGFSLSDKHNETLAYPEIVNAFRILSVLLFGVICFLFSKNIFYTTLMFIYAFFINLFTSSAPLALSFSFRGLILLIQSFIVSKILLFDSKKLRRWGSLAFGVSSLISQLFTAELGLYSIVLFVLSSIVVFLLKLKFINLRYIIECNLIMLISYLTSNLFLSIVFLLTAHYSINLFDYQLYSLELMRGYANTMSAPWAADLKMTTALLSVTISLILLAIIISRGLKTKEAILVVCASIAAIIFIRQATLRSDIGHILAGFVPVIVVFMLLINWLRAAFLKLIWFINIVFLALAWPLTNLYLHADYEASSVEKIIFDKLNLANQIGQHLNRRYILNFPSENYIGIMLQKELVTPVILAHNAHTVLLQERYTKILKERWQELDITYSLDNIATGAIDGVQHVSRLPIVFDYLWQNYRLKENISFDDAIYILRPRIELSPTLPKSVLQFKVRQEGQQLVAYLDQAVRCPLIKIEMYVAYPLYAFLGRPNGIWAEFLNGSQPVHKSGLVAIETNRVFYTYISLLDDKHFYSLFSDQVYSPKQWDRLILSYRDTGFLGVNPSDLRIVALYCVLAKDD